MGKKGDKTGIKLDKLLRKTGVKLDRKIEKKLRKAGDKVTEAVGSPKGKQVIAAGLAMAASMAAARAAQSAAPPRPPEPPVPPVPPEAPVPPAAPDAPQPFAHRHEGEALSPELGKAIDALGAAANAFIAGFMNKKP